MMTAATIFSGIGAPETAMPHWRWPWCAEIEKFPAAVLAVRHPESVNLGDVTADDFCERARGCARPDILIFGSPCQDFSVAGKRLGMAGARGNMALIALGIVGRIKPSWFVFENVPGLLSNWSGAEDGPAEAGAEWESVENSDFAAFLGAVDELRYSGAWASLDAQYRGVAQRRERLFFVGHSGEWRGPAAVLFEPESLCGYHPPRRESGQRPDPTIAARTKGGGGLGTDFDCDGGLIASTGDISHCLNAGGMGRIDYESETLISHALRAEGLDASEDGTGRGTPIVPVRRNGSNIGTDLPSLRRGNGHMTGGVPAIAFSCKDHGADAMDDCARTLRAGTHDKSHANAGVPPAVTVALRGRENGGTAEMGGETATALRASQCDGDKPYVLTSAVRRLTPRECERLQGFPDDYTAITYRGKPAADGPRYKALGNSMAVPVMRWILSRIEAVSEVSHAG
jgi:DNA (cytosine-5)-methyltransferase 1